MDCRLGSKRRRVRLFACETLLPNCGPLPQTSHRFAIDFLKTSELVVKSARKKRVLVSNRALNGLYSKRKFIAKGFRRRQVWRERPRQPQGVLRHLVKQLFVSLKEQKVKVQRVSIYIIVAVVLGMFALSACNRP